MIELRDQADGVTFRVRVQPGAPRSRVVGPYNGALKVAVAAPPEKGKANRALCEFLAASLGLHQRQVEVIAGDTSRDKVLRVTGVAKDELERRLAAF